MLFYVVCGGHSNSTGFMTREFFSLPSNREASFGAKIVLLLVGLNVIAKPSSVLRYFV